MSNGFDIFTTDGLDADGYPRAVNSCVRSVAKLFAVGSRVLSAIFTLAFAPGNPSCCEYTTDARASAPFATSQLLVYFDRPVGLNWNEQSDGSAITTTCTVSCAFDSAGLAVSAMYLNTGK